LGNRNHRADERTHCRQAIARLQRAQRRREAHQTHLLSDCGNALPEGRSGRRALHTAQAHGAREAEGSLRRSGNIAFGKTSEQPAADDQKNAHGQEAEVVGRPMTCTLADVVQAENLMVNETLD
jgi:hypothetical protein